MTDLPSPPSHFEDALLDSSCVGEVPSGSSGDMGVNVNVSEVLPPHNDAHSLIAVQASEGSSSFPLSEDLPAITTTGVLEGGFVPWSDSRYCGVGGTDASPPSPKALLCVSVWKRPLAGRVASDCSLDDSILEFMPRAAPVSKKPVAKMAARPTVVASHVPLGKHSSKKTD